MQFSEEHKQTNCNNLRPEGDCIPEDVLLETFKSVRGKGLHETDNDSDITSNTDTATEDESDKEVDSKSKLKSKPKNNTSSHYNRNTHHGQNIRDYKSITNRYDRSDANISKPGKNKKVKDEIIKEVGCDNEICAAKKLNPKLVKEYFKIKGPANNDDLLSNFDIDDVLYGWSVSSFPNFYHIYYQMIDFAKNKTELAKIDVAKMVAENKYNCLGVVLNTDVSTGAGKHWFCLFVDWRNKPKVTVEYFNSSGNRPMREVQGWLIATNQYLKTAGFNSEIIMNSLQHQRDSDTECGPYSLYYIWSRLHDVPYSLFNEKRIKDSEMLEFRKVLFRE